MKEFTIISDELYAVPNDGYKFDLTAYTCNQFEEIWNRKAMTIFEWENNCCRYTDSLCDLDGAYLCSDENGDMYAVLYLYSHIHEKTIPAVWQRVIKY